MYYTLGTAAKATGISKPSLSRAIKIGTISAEKQENGSFRIEASELYRVYPPVAQKLVADQEREALRNGSRNPSEHAVVTREIVALLREMLNSKEAELARLMEAAKDLKEDRDKWRTQAEKLMLTDQRPILAQAPVEAKQASPKADTKHRALLPKRAWWSFGKRE